MSTVLFNVVTMRPLLAIPTLHNSLCGVSSVSADFFGYILSDQHLQKHTSKRYGKLLQILMPVHTARLLKLVLEAPISIPFTHAVV